jgi:potassium efflux system protein
MKYRLVVMHQLHQAIDREFKKAGIRISFPQRDVHLDASRPLRVHLEAEETATKEPAPALDSEEESS